MSENKIAVITGASQGIGRAIALGLAKEGYRCVLLARSQDKLQALSKEIQSIKQALKPDVKVVDVMDENAVIQSIAEICVRWQRIDVLVNNAGLWQKSSLGVTTENIKKLMDTNLIAPYLFINATLPIMKWQGSGYIINISSRSGKIGFAGSGLYSASKFALNGLSESLYKELSAFGIKLTNICPSWVNTTMAMQAGSPLKPEEMIQTQDIAETVRYLLKLPSAVCIKEIILECQNTL